MSPTSLTFALLTLGGALFWAGFLRPPFVFRHRARVGFFACLVLAGVSGYFALRAKRTVGELAEFIDPVPEITDITYVPTAAETQTLSRFLAAVPGTTRFGSTPSERRDLAERMEERRTDYWILKTALPADSVFSFYRDVAPRRGWRIRTDDPPWMLLDRGDDNLVLFVTDDFPRPGIKVLYGLTVGS